jgi:hypothetical protein
MFSADGQSRRSRAGVFSLIALAWPGLAAAKPEPPPFADLPGTPVRPAPKPHPVASSPRPASAPPHAAAPVPRPPANAAHPAAPVARPVTAIAHPAPPAARLAADVGPPALAVAPEPVKHLDTFTHEFKVPEPDSIQPTVSFPFNARVDHTITSAQVRLVFAPFKPHGESVRALKVFVNDQEIGSVAWDELVRHRDPQVVTVPPKVLRDRNNLMLRMIAEGGGRCGEVPEGAWRSARSIQVVTEATTVEMPNELALFPLPFVDRDFDRAGSVTFVLPSTRTGSTLELAGIVAGWFGTSAAQDLTFPVRVGDVPEDRHAVVFVENVEQATALGLPPPDGAIVRVLNNPKAVDHDFKVLMIAGRTPDELALAARGFATQAVPLEGDVARYSGALPVHRSSPYDAPWWVPANKVVSFEQYPQTPYLGTPDFALPAGRDGTIAVRFRAAPDLWTWPTEFVDLDLGYSVDLGPGGSPPRLDLEFNGNFIATLPPLDAQAGETNGRVNLRVRAEQIRGFNELQLHVRYPKYADECETKPDEQSKVSISPDSTLHIEPFNHFANLPNVGMFVHDGYPFTRVADLGETAVVLPDEPHAEEVSSFLSIMAHFGTITGRVGDRVQLMTADELLDGPSLDKDVLLIGTMEDHPAMRQWASLLPLAMGPSISHAQQPAEPNPLRRLWHSALAYFDLQRLHSVLFHERRFAAVMGLKSPLDPHRSVVVVTASTVPLLPSVDRLVGVLETRSRSGDLLIASGVQRWMFQIGPVYGQGHLSDWTAFRRFFAMQFVLLFPGLILGSVLIAVQVRTGMLRLIKRRLEQDS